MSVPIPKKQQSRRLFLRQIGMAGGMLAVSGTILDAFAAGDQDQVIGQLFPKDQQRIPIDFRHAPAAWQSLLNFPGENSLTVVGRQGEMIFTADGAPGAAAAQDIILAVGIAGKKVEFVEQLFEAPEVPVLTTRLQTADLLITITSFASRTEGEGRVDNHRIVFTPRKGEEVPVEAELAVTSSSAVTVAGPAEGSRVHAVLLGPEPGSFFFGVDAGVTVQRKGDRTRLAFDKKETSADTPLTCHLRFPRAGQNAGQLESGFQNIAALLDQTKVFWRSIAAAESLHPVHPDYLPLVPIALNTIHQASVVTEGGKTIFHRGPGYEKTVSVTDISIMLEALAQFGHGDEAFKGLEAVWDMQDTYGLISGSEGETSLKDTGAALYLLGRQCDLRQNWDLFNQLWPDAVKAVMRIRAVRDREANFTETLNGKYGLLPRGTLESGQATRHADISNTLWVLMGLRQIMAVANKLVSGKRTDVRDFQRELYLALQAYGQAEMKPHADGFSYMPALAGDDPLMNEKDKKKRPLPQFAQFAMTHTFFPGLVHRAENPFIVGHGKLMQTILKEDVPIGTGFQGGDAFQTYHAAALAQFFIWQGMPDLAVKIFRGLVNHASPVYGWWDEQSLAGATRAVREGAMPSALTAAESLLFLRNAVILEDEDRIRLIDGIVEQDLTARNRIGFLKVPTRWGKISFVIEPVDAKTWHGTFSREEFDGRINPTLKTIEFPRRLTPKIQFDKVTGGKAVTNGGRVLVDPGSLTWEVTWKDFTGK